MVAARGEAPPEARPAPVTLVGMVACLLADEAAS